MVPQSPHMTLAVRVALKCGFPFKGFYEMSRKTVGRPLGNDWRPEAIKKRFQEYNEAVIRECPKDRLLVFKATDGWEPLCKFLGKPVPDVPYPHVNDTEQFQGYIKPIKRVGRIIMTVPVALIATAVAVVLKRK
eukprot:scaffold395020_cov32-Prasinocladus_malaysianus.AAC.2